MLAPDKAEAALKEFQVEDWQEMRLAAAARLPGDLRTAARAVLGHDAKGRAVDDWDQRGRQRVNAARLLDGLSGPDRLKVFGALLPELAAAVEAAWQLRTR